MVNLRCLPSLNLNWYKSYDTKPRNAKNANMCFCTKLQKTEMYGFCVITIELIRTQTHLAPKNDRLNLIFVKDENTYGKKMTRNGCRTVI